MYIIVSLGRTPNPPSSPHLEADAEDLRISMVWPMMELRSGLIKSSGLVECCFQVSLAVGVAQDVASR